MEKIDHAPIEQVWDDLLSRQKEKILPAFTNLSKSNKQSVLGHLERMIKENGWQVEQRQSARIALEILKKLPNRNERK